MGGRTAIKAFLTPLFLSYARLEGVDVDELLRRFELPPLEMEMERQVPSPVTPTSSQLVVDTERAVRTTLELGAPRIEKIAESLGMSVRPLQRRLDDEKTSFQEVVERTRERLARQPAQRGELSSTQMAFVLGYADVTAFLRAFKRWTGTSPQEFRGGKRVTRTAKTTR